jgi:hypothetical protein
VFAGIGSNKTDEGGPGRTWRDPHVVYATTSKGDLTSLHASDVLGSSDAAAGQWTKIMAGMLPVQQACAKSSSVWVVGFATVKNDKYLEAMECVIPFPCVPHQIEDSIEKIERWQKEGRSLVRKLRPSDKKAFTRKHIEIPPMVAAIRSHVEGIVSAKTNELFAEGDNAWERAAREYSPMMAVIAKSLSPGFTTAAVHRRHQIASVTPDMRPKTEADKKPGRNKGEDK